MNEPLPEEAIAYLLTLEMGLKHNLFSHREALQRAFSAGRTRGVVEGLTRAQEVLFSKEPS